MSSRRPAPHSRFGALLAHRGPLVHVTRAPAPSPTGAIFDDDRLTVDMLLKIAAQANCASIANLASTSAAVRALMAEDFFWRVLGLEKGYDMPSEQDVGMSPYQTFWTACMQGERDARERQRLLDAQLKTALNTQRWDEALVAVRAGADPNVDVGGGRRALDVAFGGVIPSFGSKLVALSFFEPQLSTVLVSIATRWVLVQELASLGGRPTFHLVDPNDAPGRFTRDAIETLHAEALRVVLQLGQVDLSMTGWFVVDFKSTALWSMITGRSALEPRVLNLVRQTGFVLHREDETLLMNTYIRADEGGDARRTMRERIVMAFTNGQALVDEFEAAATDQQSRVPQPSPQPPPVDREQVRTDPLRVLYDQYANATPSGRAALMNHARRVLDRELPRRNVGPAAPAVSALKVYTMIEEYEKDEAGQARARQLFREWLRGPLLGPSEATRESARRLGDAFGEITQRQDAQAAEPAAARAARADDEARRERALLGAMGAEDGDDVRLARGLDRLGV